jgi:hypothetical protein
MELRTHPATTGEWHVNEPRIVWVFAGRSLPLNASELKITDSPAWSAPETLSGERVVQVDREYDEIRTELPLLVRPGMIHDLPKRLELTFPRLPTDFYFFLRHLHTFNRPFTVEIDLFSAHDRELLYSTDQRWYYASTGGWKEGEVALWKNGVLLDIEDSSIEAVNYAWGWLQFAVGANAPEDVLEITYTWAPLVVTLGMLEPEFKAGRRDAQAAVKLTLQELR